MQKSLHVLDNRDFKIHYGGLLLRLLRPWGTRLTTPFPPQTSNRLRLRCTATGCSVSTCLYKIGYVRLYSTFIWQRLHKWEWFPTLVSILHLPELRFASQLLLEPPVIPTTKQNNTDKKLVFSTSRVFVQCDKSENSVTFWTAQLSRYKLKLPYLRRSERAGSFESRLTLTPG